MLLAAGRGERMRPLSDRVPKALLEVRGKALVVHVIERLRAAGFRELVINHAWLGERLVAALGDGSALGVRIAWSPEPDGALETGGGIRQALPLLGDAPFVACNADVWSDFDFARLRQAPADLAHLVLVDNPPWHPRGDFVLEAGRVRDGGGSTARGAGGGSPGDRDGLQARSRGDAPAWKGEEAPAGGGAGAAATDAAASRRLTFSGIGLYRPELFAGPHPRRFPLAPLLRTAMGAGQVTGEHHAGVWSDVGTPHRLEALRATLGG